MVGKTYKPLLVRYLSRTRNYSYRGIQLEIPPQVFHPGYFSSSKLLLHAISGLPLHRKKFLEPGAGSGLISIYAARQGAFTTCTDINPFSIDCLQKNREQNQVTMNIIQSDLFDNLPVQLFDIVAINPPYYKKEPVTPADHAWYCGENGEYFEKLFASLGTYIHKDAIVYMVLCDGCDLEMIRGKAAYHGFALHCILTRQTLLERNFIFKIEQSS